MVVLIMFLCVIGSLWIGLPVPWTTSIERQSNPACDRLSILMRPRKGPIMWSPQITLQGPGIRHRESVAHILVSLF